MGDAGHPAASVGGAPAHEGFGDESGGANGGRRPGAEVGEVQPTDTPVDRPADHGSHAATSRVRVLDIRRLDIRGLDLRVTVPYLPALLGLIVGVLVLGPGLGRGFLLRIDMVALPNPPLKGALLGFSSSAPRAVPSDLVLTILGRILPADLAQKALLLGIFVIAAAGAGALMSPFPLAARLTAAFFFTWNPYVAERLLIGHWALLYGYASMPWIVRAVRGVRGVRERPSWHRITLAMLPAAVGGFAAMLVAGTVLAGACLVRRSRRAAGIGATVWTACSLPWLLPSLYSSGSLTGDPTGVDAFASRADTPLGAIGSLLMLGGIWNRDSVPDRYADAPLLTVRVILTLVALAGAAVLWSRSGLRSRRGLAVLVLPSLLGLFIAGFTTTIPGRALLRTTIKSVPAAGVFRDAQQFVAPLALLEAVGLGCAVAALLTARKLRGQGAMAYAGTAMILPLIALPQLVWGISDTLRPATYPPDWAAVRKIVDADHAPGAILLLPWSAYRVYAWNQGTALLDPATKAFSRRVVADDELVVGSAVVAGEDPIAKDVSALLATGGGTISSADCSKLGIRYVLVEGTQNAAGQDNTVPTDAKLPGLTAVYRGPGGLTLYRN